MKIIHLISGGDVGGAKTHVHSLLCGLAKTEEVQLVCFMDGPFAEEARQLKIPTKIVKSRSLRADCRALEALIRQGGYEIIHCHGSRANMMGALLRRHLQIPVVTTVHSDYRLDYLGRPLHRVTFGTINKIALRFLDYYIGVSDSMARLLISRGFDPKRMFSIYNGVDFTPVTPPLDRAAFFEKIGLQTERDSVVFGIAARISPVKDMTTLVRAFGQAVRQCPSIRLVIAGDGEQAAEIRGLASACCPAGTVCFAGWLTDTDSFYNAIDVNVLTSLSETFPYALTEGARMHCATIASRVGGVPDLIEDGVQGLLFTARDIAAWRPICRPWPATKRRGCGCRRRFMKRPSASSPSRRRWRGSGRSIEQDPGPDSAAAAGARRRPDLRAPTAGATPGTMRFCRRSWISCAM